MKLRQKVFHDAVTNNLARVGSGAWLQENKSFDHALSLPLDAMPIVSALLDELIGEKVIHKRAQKEKDLVSILANITMARKSVSVSLHRNEWSHSRYHECSYSIIDLINLLHEKGFIHMKKGFKMDNYSMMTRIWATDKLLEYCPLVPNMIIYKPPELVILKNAKKKLLKYKDTAYTLRVRSILEKVNKVNSTASITYGDELLSVHLHAYYWENFSLYGRLHSKGVRHYQGYSGVERGEFRINGDPIVELDFSGLHPRLLYAREGIQFNDDPYTIVDNRPAIRPFLKVILLAMLNAKDFIAAEKAGNRWIRKEKRSPTAELQRVAVRLAGVFKARGMMMAFAKAHAPIAHHFCHGKQTGLTVMNLDSRIALDVVHHFAKRKIPCLSVHDSFIVQAHHENALRDIMDKAYRKHTGGFSCPIK